MRFFTPSLVATLIVALTSLPTPAQTLAPNLRRAASACGDECAAEYDLSPAASEWEEGCNGNCGDCGQCGGCGTSCCRPADCGGRQGRRCGRQTGCLSLWAGNRGRRTPCRKRPTNCCATQSGCCGAQGGCQGGCQSGCQSDCQSGCQSSCQSGCQNGCQSSCQSSPRSGGCLIGTLLGNVKEAVDATVAGCTPWVDRRTPFSRPSATYASENGPSEATVSIVAETREGDAGMNRVTTGRGDVEVVPRAQWPAEYRDAPVPSPPKLTGSKARSSRNGHATYQARIPTLARTTQPRATDGLSDAGPAEQVTAWVADSEQPQQEDITAIATDLDD